MCAQRWPKARFISFLDTRPSSQRTDRDIIYDDNEQNVVTKDGYHKL